MIKTTIKLDVGDDAAERTPQSFVRVKGQSAAPPVLRAGRAFVLLAPNQDDGHFVHFEAVRNAVKPDLVLSLVVVAHARRHKLRPVCLAQLVRTLPSVFQLCLCIDNNFFGKLDDVGVPFDHVLVHFRLAVKRV
jgi:hypothetical protein